MKLTFGGIPLAEIAGLETYHDYRIIYHDDRPSQLITLEDAKVVAAMWGSKVVNRKPQDTLGLLSLPIHHR